VVGDLVCLDLDLETLGLVDVVQSTSRFPWPVQLFHHHPGSLERDNR